LLVEALGTAGAMIAAEGTWEGTIKVVVGWWHHRSQLRALADAIESFLKSGRIASIRADDYETIPDDLPKRRLGTIASPMEST
jgi:hypothetical protein